MRKSLLLLAALALGGCAEFADAPNVAVAAAECRERLRFAKTPADSLRMLDSTTGLMPYNGQLRCASALAIDANTGGRR